MGQSENRNIEVKGDDTGDRSGFGMLDCSCIFIWDDCRVSDEEVQRMVKLWA